MDFNTVEDVIGAQVKKLDLDHMDPGQLVTVVTQKGTFWITRLKGTDFHGSDYVAPIAIWGTDFASGDPLDMKCTRQLKAGDLFEVFHGSEATEVRIEHILLPVVKAV